MAPMTMGARYLIDAWKSPTYDVMDAIVKAASADENHPLMVAITVP
jgi:hypothetical protein